MLLLLLSFLCCFLSASCLYFPIEVLVLSESLVLLSAFLFLFLQCFFLLLQVCCKLANELLLSLKLIRNRCALMKFAVGMKIERLVGLYRSRKIMNAIFLP